MRPFLVFLIMILAFGCSSQVQPKEPDHLISKDKMVDILYDVLILNAAKGTSKASLENQGVYPENYIYKKYHIDSLQFATSHSYYSYHIEDYEIIMSKLEQKYNLDKEMFESNISKENLSQQKKKDSLRMSKKAFNNKN
ncbi:DUF4296 domain-containing protein [Psychroserpens damuponensis]|uniref:DUF4296 domain-containing protein n=1 Tax=Psychroserpens damuponensis TaxID=943936 RepID=UPI00069425C6|nr:DUF4296 domain-containing protein [Psychroserpens damuponensis]